VHKDVPMFVFGNFLHALAKIIDIALSLYMWVIIARAVISWVSPDPYNPLVRFLYGVTEPVLDRVRRLLPISLGGMDFSPIIIILIIVFLQSFLVPTLADIAGQLG
jgi:YggT family protein